MSTHSAAWSRRLPRPLTLRVLACATCVAALVGGCAQEPDPQLQAARDRASQLAAQIATPSAANPAPTRQTKPAAPQNTVSTDTPRPSDAAIPTRASDKPSPSGPLAVVQRWSRYPWPPNTDGKACPPPSVDARVEDDTRIVVILGDSLIRNARLDIESSLARDGWTAVFVCWGGRTTRWGREQLALMRDLGLTPSCLVVNLGTNDVKNDAVSNEQLQARLTELLGDTRSIPGVAAVDLWANTALAPSTMANIAGSVAAFPAATSTVGHGVVISWSQQARADPSLVGSDGVHDTIRGQQIRAALIADAVSQTC